MHPFRHFACRANPRKPPSNKHSKGPMMTSIVFAAAFFCQGDWKAAEGKSLGEIRQVTSDFARAGEGYFSPDGKTIIFQAEDKNSGNPFYQIYTQKLETGAAPHRVSPGVGKTTCSYFSPDGKKIIFASTHLDP